MRKTIYLTLLLGGIAVSCNSDQTWTDADEKEFVSGCESSFINGFESTVGDNMDMVDRDELDNLASNYCNCAFESIKKKHKSPQEALKLSTDELLKDVKGCDPTDEDINKLLK